MSNPISTFSQIYLDMAVLVDAQGEILDNIESQVCSLSRTLDFLFACVYVECRAYLVRFALMRGLFRSTTQSIMSKEGHLHFKMLRNSRRTLENGCALPSLFY